ncbi:MAG: GreA/GreB family elongation factor [Crocinitomicaceae bacterium]|nr:GreA/GreB family elongation factor [Crocinitomicaceae bacterium]
MKIYKEEKKYLLDILNRTMLYTGELDELCRNLRERIEVGDACDDNYEQFDRIYMGRIFSIKTSFGIKSGIRLVEPENANMEFNRLSVLSSLGSQLYGRKEGEVIKMKNGDILEFVEIIYVSKTKDIEDKLKFSNP